MKLSEFQTHCLVAIAGADAGGDEGDRSLTFIPMNENLSGYPPHFENAQKFSYIEMSDRQGESTKACRPYSWMLKSQLKSQLKANL